MGDYQLTDPEDQWLDVVAGRITTSRSTFLCDDPDHLRVYRCGSLQL